MRCLFNYVRNNKTDREKQMNKKKSHSGDMFWGWRQTLIKAKVEHQGTV